MKRKKTLTIYFLIIFFLVLGYFIDNPLIDKGFYKLVNDYMGRMTIPTLIFFILYGMIFSIDDKKKKFFLEIKLYFVIFFILLGIYLWILYSMDITYTTVKGIALDNSFFKGLIDISLYNYFLGYFPTYIFYELMRLSTRIPYPFYQFYYSLVGVEALLFFLIVFNPIKNTIKDSIKNHRIKVEKRRIENSLEEQIRIKEELDRKEKIKEEIIKREKFEKIKKGKIHKSNKMSAQAKFENTMGNISLTKTVTIKEDDE